MSGRSFWTAEQWMTWPSRKRARTINSLSGFKSANVIGTADAQGVHNLSVVSSVVHLGSSPAQMGVVLRRLGQTPTRTRTLWPQASAPSTMWGRLGSSKPTSAVRVTRPTCRNSRKRA